MRLLVLSPTATAMSSAGLRGSSYRITTDDAKRQYTECCTDTRIVYSRLCSVVYYFIIN
jgi:hypothetical protein